MNDDKPQVNAGVRPEQATAEQIGRTPQPREAGTAAQPGRRTPPGRKPLFRN